MDDKMRDLMRMYMFSSFYKKTHIISMHIYLLITMTTNERIAADAVLTGPALLSPFGMKIIYDDVRERFDRDDVKVSRIVPIPYDVYIKFRNSPEWQADN